MKKPSFNEDFIRFWLMKFRKFDISQKKQRKALIEIFVISQRSLHCKLLCEKSYLCAHRADKTTDQYPIECSI